MSNVAKLEVAFTRPGTSDRGRMFFEGDANFLNIAAGLLSYTIGTLSAAYGMDKTNWTQVGNELMAAWEAVKDGQDYKGEVVKVTITKDHAESAP